MAVDEIVLWNTEGTSDKVWGVVPYKDRAIRFWGARKAELAFKLLSAKEQRDAEKLANKKRRDGYRDSSFEALEAEQEGWRGNFDQMLLMAILGDGFTATKPEVIASV
jgi:hypothetical protein